VLIVLGSLLAFLSVFAIWTERQALDTGEWVNTSGRLIQNAKIREAVSKYLVDQLYENVDVEKEVGKKLPKEFKDLAGPISGGVRQVAGSGAEKVLESSTAQELWKSANKTTHEQLLEVLEEKEGTLSTEEGKVSLDLGSLATNIADQVGISANLEGAGQITILRSDQLKTAQDIVVAIKGLALILSLLTFLCFGLAIYLSREGRWVTVLYCGIGLVAAGFAVIVFREVAGGIVVGQLVEEDSVKPAAEAAWSIGTSLMTSIATTVIIIGVLFGIAGWLASPTGPARSTRHAIAPSLREYPAYVYAGLAILVGIYFADPEPAFLPHHAGDRRPCRLRHPRAAQTDRRGIPRRQLRRRRRPHQGQGGRRGQRRQSGRAGVKTAPARDAKVKRRGRQRGRDRDHANRRRGRATRPPREARFTT
jgi:hypothetical protein